MGEAISQYLKKVIQEKAIELTKQKGISSLVDDAKIYRSLRSYLASSDAIEVNDPYEKSVWVFASINAIAQNIARVPFYLYQEKKKNLKTIINEGPLYELFTNPNPYMITSTLMFATVLFMELYGEAFWVLEGRDNITQIPKEIWCINPTRFSPVIDKEHQFKGFWEYSIRDSKVIFAPHEILQFKYFNPYDDIRGTSGLEASRLGVEQDYLAGKYNKQFFKDGISLSGLVQTPDFLTDEQYNRLKNQFEERHAGYGNAHKVGIIEGGATFAETKVMSQRDMEFSVLKTVIRGEILAAFKTNEVVLGNYENIQCFTPGTDILTDKGFQRVEDIKIGDSAISMNPETGIMEYKPVTEVFEYDYEGDVYTQKKTKNRKASKVDFLITPEHKMFGKERKIKKNAGKYKTENFIFKKISEINEDVEFCSPRNGIWGGETIENFVIEKRAYERKDYKNGSKDGYKETTFPIIPFLKFLGWFISEGCYKSEETFELSITQVKEKGRIQLKKDLENFPYGIREHGKEFVLSGKDLYNYLLENVGHYCYEKRIPREILNLHPSLLKYLFDALIAGDGTKVGKGCRYMTTSKGLANDVQELAIKLGYAPILYEEGRHGLSKMKPETRYPNAKQMFYVNIPSIESATDMTVIKPEKVEGYKGKIYCIAVPPYHTLLSRYNGKILIISNSYEGIKQAHESFWKETLLPKIIYLEDFLWAKFFSKIQNGKTWGGYDTSVIEALREDYRNKVEMAEILSKMGYPLNSINKRLDMGFEDVPWGNTWFVRMGTVPVEYVLENPNPKPNEPTEEPGNAPDDDEEEPGNAPGEEDDEEPKEEPNEGKDLRDNSVWSSFISRQIPVENMFKSKIKRFLYEQRKRALANLFNKIEILNEEEEKKKLVVILNSLYEVANVTGKELLKEELFLEEIEYPEIFKSIQDRVEFSSSTIIKTINNSLMKLLNDNDSKDIQAKAQLIRTFYNKTDNKVSIIARTESAAIINLVRFIIMQNQGVKHHKWISRLEHSRHIKFNNKIVRIGESFSEDFVIRYPHDKKAPVGETVGCLCFTVPVVKYK